MARRVQRQLVVLTFAATAFAQTAAFDRISPESLRANVTYLASDELEGRDTPSRGLDKAADYIAEQFKKAGLDPVNGSYFQVAKMSDLGARDRKSTRLNSSH